MSGWPRAWAAGVPLSLGLGLGLVPPSLAGVPLAALCERSSPRSATEHDRVLQVSAWLQQQLAEDLGPASGESARTAALVARSGTQLGRFGIRYTHAGFSLRHNPQGAWGVRQLYFACDEQRPRLFDQGLAGFLLGSDPAPVQFVLVVLPPPAVALMWSTWALDAARARALLSPHYLASAHPWDAGRQNCNQWVAEVLGDGAGQIRSAEPAAEAPARRDETLVQARRQQAQSWLQAAGHRTTPVEGGTWFWRSVAGAFPWVSFAHHPPEELARQQVHTTLPTDLADLAQRLWAGVQRWELCYTDRQAVLRTSGPPLGGACQPMPGDRVLAFE